MTTQTIRPPSRPGRWRSLLQQVTSNRGDSGQESTPTLADAARAAGWSLHGPQQSFLADLDLVLRAHSAADVALVVGAHPTPIGGIVAAAYPAARVQTFDIGANRSALHTQLAAGGPFDVLLDDTRHGDQHLRLLRDTFFHLRAGGAFVARDHRSEPDHRRSHAPRGDLMPFLGELLRDRHQDASRVFGAQRDQAMLAKSIGEITIGERHLVLRSQVNAFAKLREDEMNRVLAAKPAAGRVLATIPGQTFQSRGVRLTGAERSDHRRPQEFAVPAMSVREYNDVVCTEGQVVVQDNLLLPDSFRHNQYPRLTNRWTIDLAPGFAQDPRVADATDHLDGAYFYLDLEWRGHFGHVMTEQLSRMWAWPQAKREHPELKALMSLARNAAGVASWQVELLRVAGIDEEDLVTFVGPVRVEKLVAATPMFSMPSYVHPSIEGVWNDVGRTLAAGAPGGDYPSRIFVSRRPAPTRPCHNATELEDLFAAHGFAVLYPEDLSLSEQAGDVPPGRRRCRVRGQRDVLAGVLRVAQAGDHHCPGVVHVHQRVHDQCRPRPPDGRDLVDAGPPASGRWLEQRSVPQRLHLRLRRRRGRARTDPGGPRHMIRPDPTGREMPW